MSKFKVGDRVEIQAGDWSGVKATVKSLGSEYVRVQPDTGSVYTGSNSGTPISSRYMKHPYAGFHEEELKLISAPAIDAHYTKYAIQPMEFSLANGLDAAQHTVIKYTVRYRDKAGIRDLMAAIRVLELMIEREERAQANG